MACHVMSCDPQFPWVLVDYESPELNLEDPSVFRDFTKPVGVQNPRVEEQVRERWVLRHHMTGHVTQTRESLNIKIHINHSLSYVRCISHDRSCDHHMMGHVVSTWWVM